MVADLRILALVHATARGEVRRLDHLRIDAASVDEPNSRTLVVFEKLELSKVSATTQAVFALPLAWVPQVLEREAFVRWCNEFDVNQPRNAPDIESMFDALPPCRVIFATPDAYQMACDLTIKGLAFNFVGKRIFYHDTPIHRIADVEGITVWAGVGEQ